MQNALRSILPRFGTFAKQRRLQSLGCTPLSVRVMSTEYNYETLKVTQPAEFVLNVELNRPEKRNAMNRAFWREMVECFKQVSLDEDCRAVVLTGAGKIFTAGIDLMDFAGLFDPDQKTDISKKANFLRNIALEYQESFTIIEKCPKPVIAAMHSACVGGGVDMSSACDIRYCTQDAWFQVKEVDIGMAADVGTLQRLPRVVGSDSLARELCYTARKMMSDEAKDCGFVSRVFPDRDALVAGALETAALIASKSPVGIQGTKINLVYARDHSVAESLQYVATWNQTMLQSQDLITAATASIQKTKAVFPKL